METTAAYTLAPGVFPPDEARVPGQHGNEVVGLGQVHGDGVAGVQVEGNNPARNSPPIRGEYFVEGGFHVFVVHLGSF